MYRDLFTVPGPGVTLHGFGLMLVLGSFAALRLTAWRARRERLDPEDVYGLAVWLLTGGVLGARLFYVLQHHETIHHVGDIFRIWQGGIVFYGCIIGGLIGSVLYWVRHPFPFRPMADAVAPALMIGVALGRIGCFLNGCCFGAVSRAPWAVTFPAGTAPWASHVTAGWIPPSMPHSLPVHPTQLYAALDGFLVLALLSWYFPRRRRDGEVMALLMVAYPIARFIEESLRADEGAFFAGLTISQNISVALLVCGVVFWAWLVRQPKARFADDAVGPAVADRQSAGDGRPYELSHSSQCEATNSSSGSSG
jgi:phosphatidylglycerol:prolipoprotein diacylglycerol transferase